jgi:tetrapyrrole methylase family protein/MazG family protein
MKHADILLLGLGPGNPNALTKEAWQVLNNSSEIWLRTRKHPTVKSFPENLHVHSFDDVYERENSFEEVYEQIVSRVLKLGEREQGVLYAVPGHPYVAETTCPRIASLARERGMNVRIVEGLSFIEPVLTALNMDIFPQTTLVDAMDLAEAQFPEFPPHSPAIVTQIYSRDIASQVKLTLSALYPDEHEVHLVHSAGMLEQRVESIPLYAIDRSPYINLLTALYVPPLGAATSFEEFENLIARLRAPDGCPWDREQTHKSLRSSLLEETYEILAAIDADDTPSMCEELGDLLLLIVMHVQIAAEFGEFNMAEVLNGIHTKIVHRHPHVFAKQEVKDDREILENWERLKEEERAASGKEKQGLLEGINLALPALVQAYQYQARAAHIGFDWTDLQGVWDKVNEEIDEVLSAEDQENRSNEVGDLLFAIVNLARWYKVDPESALREASARFKKRFSLIETYARSRNLHLADLSLDEMEALWQEAKRSLS